MRDVARAAGVSQSTVSRVLSRTPSLVPIGEETRQKVLTVIDELGYRPNQYARTLRGLKSRMIGMLIADITNPFYHPMVRAVQDVASRHGYDLMVANSDHQRDKELHFCESIVRRPVDGIIVVPYHLTDDELDALMARTGVHVGAVGNHIEHADVDVAYADDATATYEVTRWLVEERGHRRIASITADAAFPVSVRRRGGFLRAMDDAGLAVPPEYSLATDWSVEGGRSCIVELLGRPKPPTAVVAASDTLAIGALEAAEELGVRVPEDIAIVGFDDIPAAQWVRPKLTTVAQYPAQMGTRLAEALFERIDGQQVVRPRQVLEVPCQFIERGSA